MFSHQHVDVRHMILDCAQTVQCMLQFVLWVYLGFLVIPDQIVVEPCVLAGCCSQLLCQLNSQSEGLVIPEIEPSIVVLSVLCLCCACNRLLL